MYPMLMYKFRVRAKDPAGRLRMGDRVFSTTCYLTDEEAHQRYEVVERIKGTEMVITGPAEPTSYVKPAAARYTLLQSDDIPEYPIDL